MAAKPPRKSSRIPKKTIPFNYKTPAASHVRSATAESSPLQSQRTLFQLAQSEFLTSLYAEIEAAIQGNKNPCADESVSDLIRAAQLGRFIQSLTPSQSKKLRGIATKYSPKKNNIREAYEHLLSDLDNFDPALLTRLGGFFQETRALTVCACAWSATFINALDLPETDGNDNLGWEDIQDLICKNASSIELFVLTRFTYDTFSPFSIHQRDQNALLAKQGPIWKLLTAKQKASGNYTNPNFGNTPEELTLHHPNLHQQVLNPYDWYLPNTTKPAERCQLTYTITTDLATRPKTTKRIGAQEAVDQADIPSAILLPSYVWPKKKEWPADNKDPRYAGHWNDACEVCGTVQQVCKSITAKGTQSVTRSCNCTYTDLQNNRGHPLHPFVEIIAHPRLGKGVRALQNFAEDQFLNEYIGEMYPYKTKNGAMLYDARYSGDEGECYLYVSTCQERQTLNDRIHPKALAADDAWKFYIDPAVRGNWTRYLNHSCAPNATFGDLYNVGQRMLVLVRALRPIYFGDHITVHYGADYFRGKNYGCRCGESECVLWDQEWNNRDVVVIGEKKPKGAEGKKMSSTTKAKAKTTTKKPASATEKRKEAAAAASGPGTLGDAVWNDDETLPDWVRKDLDLPVWDAYWVRVEREYEGTRTDGAGVGKTKKKKNTDTKKKSDANAGASTGAGGDAGDGAKRKNTCDKNAPVAAKRAKR